MKRCKTEKEKFIRRRLSSARGRAKRKGTEFDIDYEYLDSIAVVLHLQTGFKLEYSTELDRKNMGKPTLVRLNCTLGFIKGNMAWVPRIYHLQQIGFIDSSGRRKDDLDDDFGGTFSVT